MRGASALLLCAAGAVALAAPELPTGTAFDQWIRILRDMGFPAAVAIYVLVRLERVVNSQTEAIHQLREVIARLLERVEGRTP